MDRVFKKETLSRSINQSVTNQSVCQLSHLSGRSSVAESIGLAPTYSDLLMKVFFLLAVSLGFEQELNHFQPNATQLL